MTRSGDPGRECLPAVRPAGRPGRRHAAATPGTFLGRAHPPRAAAVRRTARRRRRAGRRAAHGPHEPGRRIVGGGDLRRAGRRQRAGRAGGVGRWAAGVVVADPNDLAFTEDQLRRHLDRPGMVGVKIHGEWSGVPTSSPRMAALFDLLARFGRPVKLHDAGDDWADALLAIARRHPRLPIVIAHAGLGTPSGSPASWRRRPTTSISSCAARSRRCVRSAPPSAPRPSSGSFGARRAAPGPRIHPWHVRRRATAAGRHRPRVLVDRRSPVREADRCSTSSSGARPSSTGTAVRRGAPTWASPAAGSPGSATWPPQRPARGSTRPGSPSRPASSTCTAIPTCRCCRAGCSVEDPAGRHHRDQRQLRHGSVPQPRRPRR